jgi:nucleoside-diphosphate-sugar epimerase
MMTTFATGSSGTIGRFFPDPVIPLSLNLTSPVEDFDCIPLQKDDVLIHAAAVVGPSNVDKDPLIARDVNIEGTRKLGITALRKGVSKFVYISTSHVYRFGPFSLTEHDDIAPINEYAAQKYAGEIALKSIFSEHAGKLCIVRVFSLLDWGMPKYSLGGAVEKLATSGSTFKLNNTSDVRDFLTPKQVAEAIYEISSSKKASGVINLCSGKAISVGEGVRQLLDLENIEVSEEKFISGNSTIPRIVGDNSRLKSLLPNLALDWKPNSRDIINGYK